MRLALAVAAVLGLVAGAAEMGLRAAGVEPRVPIELSNVVPDGWTGFRLRPGVSGPESYVTNDLGMHAPRSYALAHQGRGLRVAVLGSSVVYGLNVTFADTIPGAVERELQATGHRAEVLNFGTHGFSIVNLSALLQAYVHQFQPDAVETRKYLARSAVAALAPTELPDPTIAFTDLDPGDTFFPFASIAVKLGWMRRTPTGGFGPDRPVTTAMVHHVLVLALGLGPAADALDALHTEDGATFQVPKSFGALLLGMRLGLRHDNEDDESMDVGPKTKLSRAQVA